MLHLRRPACKGVEGSANIARRQRAVSGRAGACRTPRCATCSICSGVTKRSGCSARD